MKTRIIALLHLPPPIHGSSMVGGFIKNSELINDNFEIKYLNLLAADKLNGSRKITLKKVVLSLKIWIELFCYLITFQPKLCYYAITATGIAFLRDVVFIGTIKIFGVKIVYHMHNKGVAAAAEKVGFSSLYKFVFYNSKVILLSHRLYCDVSQFVSRDDLFICPNGIPVSRGLIEKKNVTSEKTVKLLFLSNLIESKGVFVLLKACRILKDRNYSFHCCFVGAEADIDCAKFDNITHNLGIESVVSYVGRKVNEEKNEYLCESDIFVLPTFYKYETFGLVNIEAMQYGLPVITTDEGGIPDIVENGVNGFIVNKNDAEDLAEKLQTLIGDQILRRKMGDAGREKFRKHYTLEIFEKRLLFILGDIINRCC